MTIKLTESSNRLRSTTVKNPHETALIQRMNTINNKTL